MGMLDERIKSLVTLGVVLGLTLWLVPSSFRDQWIFAALIGAFTPILHGLIWGNERWDESPLFYIFAFLIFLIVGYLVENGYLIGRRRNYLSEFAVTYWAALISSQAFLFYLGRYEKDRK
jgi:hypothetical protein